jgi:hypothetical protein
MAGIASNGKTQKKYNLSHPELGSGPHSTGLRLVYDLPGDA